MKYSTVIVVGHYVINYLKIQITDQIWWVVNTNTEFVVEYLSRIIAYLKLGFIFLSPPSCHTQYYLIFIISKIIR